MKHKLSIILLTTLLLACQQGKKNQETQASISFEAQRNTFFNNLQAPGEVAASLQATGADFDPQWMSDPNNFSMYQTNNTKAAANLGIYLSDLNYSVAYGQGSNTNALFTAAHELSKAIGIEKGVLDFLMQRYSDNLTKNDSVKEVVTSLFEKATTGLQGTDRERLVGIAMASYQIENLHLALGLIQSYPKDMLPTDARITILVPIYQMVFSQKGNVENVYSFLKAITDPMDPDKNPNYPYYANALEELIGVYNRLNVEEKIANNQGLELMNDEVVKELKEKVDAIRNKIVSMD